MSSMDAQGIDQFRLHVSRWRSTDNSARTSHKDALSSPRVGPMTLRSSTTTTMPEGQADPADVVSHSWGGRGDDDGGGGAFTQPKQHQQGEQREESPPPLLSSRTPYNSLPLSFQSDSPSAITSRPPSPLRIRPTSDLPPTKAAGEVPRSAPTAVRAEESIYHDITIQSSISLTQSPVCAVLPTSVGCSLGSSVAARAANSVSFPTQAPDEANPLRTTTCRVCALCGVAVHLVGTFIEHQEQWNRHLESWAHQGYLHMRNAPGQGDSILSSNATAGISPPLSPGMLKALEEAIASPVVMAGAGDSLTGESALPSYGASAAEAVKMHTSPSQKSPQHTASVLGGLSHVDKKLFLENSQRSTSAGDGDDKAVDTGNLEWERAAAVTETAAPPPAAAAAAVQQGGDGELREEHCHHPPLPSKPRGGGSVKSREGPSRRRRGDGNQDISFSSSLGATVPEEFTKRKERHMERVLTAFLIRKERQQLLLCLRRWFDVMFIRAMNASLSPKQGTRVALPKSGNVSSTADAQAEEERSATGLRGGEPVLSPGNITAPSEPRDTTPAPVPETAMKERRGRRKKGRSRNSATPEAAVGYVGHEAPFMASRIKDFAHTMRSSSSSSVEMEVAKTDVSWYIRHSSPRRRRAVEKDGWSSPHTSSLEGDTSIEKILSSLSLPLQRRVRALLRGEPLPHSAFPKTSEALCMMRNSSLAGTPSCWHSGFVSGSHRGSSSSPVARTSRSGSEEETVVGEVRGEQDQRALWTAAKGHVRETVAVGVQIPHDVYTPPAAVAVQAGGSDGGHLFNDMDGTSEIARQAFSGRTGVLPTQSNKSLGRSASNAIVHEDEPQYAQQSTPKSLHECQETPTDQLHPQQQHQQQQQQPLSPSTQRDETGTPYSTLYRERHSSRSLSPLEPCSGEGEGNYQPQRLRHRGRLNNDTKEEDFRGIPGAYYYYYDGVYHHVRDPTSEVCRDEAGRRRPMYVVRRPVSPASFSTRGGWLETTRPQSPLGPGRLNPYCAVCVARYNLVLVDEMMQPVTCTLQRLCGAAGIGTRAAACSCNQASGRARSSMPTRMQRGSLSPPPPLPPPLLAPLSAVRPRPACSRAARNVCGSGMSPQCSRVGGDGSPLFACREGSMLYASTTADPLHSEQCGNPQESGPPHDVLPEDEAWLRRQERRIRRRMKALLWQELPENRGSHQWVEYLTLLKEATQMLETLRLGRAANRST